MRCCYRIEFELYEPNRGGRAQAIHSGYRPNILYGIEDAKANASAYLLLYKPSVDPGSYEIKGLIETDITNYIKNYLHLGQKIYLREGMRTIGEGVIKEVYFKR